MVDPEEISRTDELVTQQYIAERARVQGGFLDKVGSIWAIYLKAEAQIWRFMCDQLPDEELQSVH